MRKKISFSVFLIIFILLLTVLIFIGLTRDTSIDKEISDFNKATNTLQKTENAGFESTTELSLTKTAYKKEHSKIKAILEEVFGGAKLTSFAEVIEAIDVDGAETSEYALKRATTPQDLDLLLRSFNEKGYETDFNIEEEKSVSFGVRDSSSEIVAYYEIGDQIITIRMAKALME